MATTIPYNFDEIYAGLETKFAEKGYDIEEGSNTAQLITAMSYLTSMLNANTAVNINETLLPTATKRKNALQDARALGYEAAPKQSYVYQLTLQITEPGTYIIPKYSKFTYEDKTYYYVGQRLEFKDISQAQVDSGYTFQINVKEGTLYKYDDYEDTLRIVTQEIEENGEMIPQYYVDIPYVDVERNGLEVYLTYYDEDGILTKREKWYKSSQFLVDADSVLNKEYIRIDDIDFSTPRLYFKMSGIGTDIRVGTIVESNVLTTSGTEGAIADITDLEGLTHSLSDIDITNIVLLVEGSDEEPIEDIQENAPLFHNSANRAVVKQDYVAICNRHQSVDSSMVWGGDDEFPKSPGHVWFSFLPSANVRNHTETDEFKLEFTLDNPEDSTNWYIETAEIRSIDYTEDGQLISPGVWDVLDEYKIPTLEFQNRHPLYLDFWYTFEILKYNIKDSRAEIHQDVFDVVNEYFKGSSSEDAIEKYEIEYFHTNVKKRVDNYLSDSTGFNNSVETKLMIGTKNVSSENVNKAYRDIFIPLAVPFEEYFDTDGNLLTSVLPNIDTTEFIENIDIYTDWSSISGDLSQEEIILAPIRAYQEEEILATDSQTIFTLENIEIQADDITQEVLTYDLTTVLVDDVELDPSEYTINSETEIELTSALSAGEMLKVEVNNQVGNYFLFNYYKKFIMAQLYVDADGYQSTGNNNFAQPKSYLTTTDDFYNYTLDDYYLTTEGTLDPNVKSYLTTVDGFYNFTIDGYYLTTEGYALSSNEDYNIITGSVVKRIIPEYYTTSALKMVYFEDTRYLNFNYNSPNFKLIRNVIPRLRSVTFE